MAMVLRKRWREASLPLVVTLTASCSLMIEFEQPPVQQSSRPARDAGVPDAGTISVLDAGGGRSSSDAGVVDDASIEPVPPAVSLLAFIEDPEESAASLRLVEPWAAFREETRVDVPSWRITLTPRAWAGDAFDFAWSPDGRRIALRYDAIDSPRIAVFRGPEWTELPIGALGMPASDPRFEATANYAWSPDGSALALELTSEAGPYITLLLVTDDAVTPLPPVAFAAKPESMAWLSPERLLVVYPGVAGREVVTLAASQGVIVQREVPGTPLSPIDLRTARAGVVGASREPGNPLYFWRPNPAPETPRMHSSSAFLSSDSLFAAEPLPESAAVSVFDLTGDDAALDTLPDCPVVLTWIGGAEAPSLAGSKIACLMATEGGARVTIYSYDAAGARSSLLLEDETLLTDLAVPANWETHGRVFSRSGEWLSLASETHDFLIDLRAPVPVYSSETFEAGARTARAFSTTGEYLLTQRGLQWSWWFLAPSGQEPPYSFGVFADAIAVPPPCSTARHASDACGASAGADTVRGRWHGSDDVAALLTASQGLSLITATDLRDGLWFRSVSTCGGGCVRQYAFAPRAANY